MFCPVKNYFVWTDVWKLELSWWRMFFRFFRIPPMTGKSSSIELTALRCSYTTFTTWPVMQKKLATICFDILRVRSTFIGFGLSWKTHTLDCRPWCHLCRCYAQLLTHLERIFSTFPCTNQYEPSFKRLSDYAGSKANKFFHGQMLMQYLIDARNNNNSFHLLFFAGSS